MHEAGPRRWIRCTDLRLASHGGGEDDDYDANGADGPDPLRPRLRRLRDLNGGSDVNPRSPRQVSRLLFGAEGRPTDRASLRRLSSGRDGDVPEEQRDAAALVLECRDLLARTSSGADSSNGRGGPSFALAAPDDVSGRDINDEVSDRELDEIDGPGGLDEASSRAPEEGGIGVTEGPIIPPPSIHDIPPSPYDRMVSDLFSNEGSSIDDYWTDPLLCLAKSSSRSLVRQLRSNKSTENCPIGYDSGKTGLLNFIREEKAKFPDAVLLVRVGDFYETYGIDAIMLVEHCGLNSMAGKARAGCPKENVQATLDGLTSAGLRVAVYEEKPWGTDPGAKTRMKERYLSQVVSSANPTYMHGLVLGDDNNSVGGTDDARHEDPSSSPGRSYVGVIETAQGYTLVEVSAEERSAVVSERLTAEAVSCRLAAYPPADPLVGAGVNF